MNSSETYHIPVLLHEAVEGLDIQSAGIYLDLTFGGGGHSKEILNRLGPNGHLYGFDQDLDTIQGIFEDERFTFVRSNYRFLKNWMQYYGVKQVDGILADLGVSSHHLDEGERGFSFRYDAPLDMRMNQQARLTARDVLQNYSEEQLADVFYLYGELKNSRRLAAAVVTARSKGALQTTGQLAETLDPLMGYDHKKKGLARVFQALRIEVNGEMKVLGQMLQAASEVLRPGGRLVILTYHSLEDRIVKNMMRTGNLEGKAKTDLYGWPSAPFRPVNRSVITPSVEEQNMNPRSRSAKLRIAEKTEL